MRTPISNRPSPMRAPTTDRVCYGKDIRALFSEITVLSLEMMSQEPREPQLLLPFRRLQEVFLSRILVSGIQRPIQVLFDDLILDRLHHFRQGVIVKDTLAQIAFEFFLLVKFAQQVLADYTAVWKTVLHRPRTSDGSICRSPYTVNNTNPEVLANSTHSDPQCIHPSESICQQSPGLDLVVSLKLVIPDY